VTGPLHDVRADTLSSLDNIESELDLADGDIKAMESLGMDVSRLKERLSWGRNAVKVIRSRVQPGK